MLQLKNAESILEFERMAEISFDKRDFRMVSEFGLNCRTDVKDSFTAMQFPRIASHCSLMHACV